MEAPILNFSFPTLPEIDLSIIANAKVLSVVLFIIFIIYSIISGILIYHWRNYGMKSVKVYIIESIFLFVSLVLFVASAMSVYYFQLG